MRHPQKNSITRAKIFFDFPGGPLGIGRLSEFDDWPLSVI
jgi:hypothetical protein